jgi:DNA-directed RNA polymerase subunit alpha
MQDDTPRTLKISVNKAGAVTAGMIECDSAVEVINKDLVLATLTEDIKFEMEMGVGIGRGYSSAAERIALKDRFDQEAGMIEVDAIYTPVLRVRYKTEDTRVGQRTNYDKLILEIWTDGTVLPQMAMVEASKILRKYINPFVQYCEIEEETVESEALVVESPTVVVDTNDLAAKMEMSIEQLNLTVRSGNCLEANNIQTVGQLVSLSEAELMKIRSFGKTSMREVRQKLSDLGLSLGMGQQSQS